MESERIELKKLRGITIACENDLYDFAKVVLKIMHTTDKLSGNTISKPTINGLARDYSTICGQKISQDEVINIVKKHGLEGNQAIDFDKEDERRHKPLKFGETIASMSK